MELSAILMPAPEGGYVAYNPETGTTTEGETVEQALENLREATELYLEEFPLAVAGRPLLTSFHVAENA
ncbi:MAG: hypothetical protein PHP75_03730 [Methylacidiphilaceae bacterium]|nr:hypothetical protein [Candidatus Methylacidiphilaceae bacterium]